MRIGSYVVLTAVALLAMVEPAFAQDGAQSSGPFLNDQGVAMLAMAIAVFGGAYSQCKAISTALEGISRNPGAAGQMFLPWLLALILIESLVIYMLVVTMKLVGFF